MGQSSITFFLNTDIAPDEIETELYKAATEAFRRSWTFMEASFQLGGRAEELGLEQTRIEAVLRSSFDLEKRREYRSEELGSAEPKKKTAKAPEQSASPFFGNMFLPPNFMGRKKSSRYINIESAIIPWPSDEWRFDLAELIHRAFEPNELFGINSTWDSPIQLNKVSDYLAVRENIPTIVRSFDGEGSWIRVNSTEGERETDVLNFRHVLLKVKGLELGKQLAFFKMFNLPCSALVNCGGKFIQGWVKVEAQGKEEYLERVTTLTKTLSEIGFDIDTQESDPLAKACMPGVLVGGKQQYLIDYDAGANSWEEWESWAEAYLDGDPLIESTMTYDEVPTRSAEVVEDVFRQGHKIFLSGKKFTGKSMLALDMGISIANGDDWCGLSTEESGVLYVNLELESVNIVNRMYEIAEEKEVDVQNGLFDFLHLLGMEKNVTEMCDFLIKRIEASRKWENKNYSTIIIDGMDKLPGFFSQDQKDHTDRFTTAQGIDKMVVQTGVGVVLVLNEESRKRIQWSPDVDLSLSIVDNFEDKKEYKLVSSGKFIENKGQYKLEWDYPLFKELK